MGVTRSIRFVRFGPFQLDVRAGELRRSGIKVRVPGQSIKVLEMLVENPGEVVMREELHQKLWPNGTIVEFDRSINAAIKRLRQALEDSAEEPKFIETLPWRGYRFLVSVERTDTAEPAGTSEPDFAADSFEGRTMSHYRIAKKLGQGGMGVVYRAEDLRLGRSVALKFLSAELSDDSRALERFEREARAASALNHPNICTVHEVGEHDGVPFIVMEYLTGKSLDQLIKRQGLPVKVVLNYAIQISDALAKAHAAGIVHRDLKPSNIMVSPEGLVKLLDFGLAKVRSAAAAADATALPTETMPLTGEGTILGTLQYMAPEQLEGKDADARTDIFALGAVIYEMATGNKAFEAKSRASLIAGILEHEPPSISASNLMAPAALDRVVKKCLAKDPDVRWQSARDLKDELEWFAEGGVVPSVTHRSNHARLAWAVASAIGVITIALGVQQFREKPAEMRAVRFSVTPPEKATFDDPVAISPDGTRLVLIVSPPEREPSLWVRRLDSLTMQPLAGTEGASDPFWSPDGQFIGFFAQERLKKIEASGGPAQTLCDVRNSGRGTWNRDGIILFSVNGALYRVAAEGGPAMPVTVVEQENQQAARICPSFLPDGRHFLYQAATQGFRNDAIYGGSLDSKETKRLVVSHWMAAYAPALHGQEGYLLFIRDGTLMAQRFDANHLQLTDKPVPLAEGVADLGQPAYFSLAANGTLAYRTAGAIRTQLTWFDRAGKQLGAVGLPVQDLYPAISPDGRRLAVSRADPQHGTNRAMLAAPSVPEDIWVMDLARGAAASRLTFDSAAERPVWSPDGSRIAFVSNRDGNLNLYQKASSGAGTEELLLKSAEDKFLSDWSADGRFLIYSSISPKTAFDLWVLPLDADRKPFPFLQTPFSEGAGRLSPDGQWMAYQSNESGRWEVYVRPFGRGAGKENQASTDKWPISTDGGVFAHWRGDGKELFYIAYERIMAVEVRSGMSKGRPTFEAGVPKRLFNVRPYGLSPFTVTADGQRFLINTQIAEEKSQSITVVLNWPALVKR